MLEPVDQSDRLILNRRRAQRKDLSRYSKLMMIVVLGASRPASTQRPALTGPAAFPT